MKLKITYILLLLFGLSFAAFAQKKKPAKKTAKAAVKKTAKAKVKKAPTKPLKVTRQVSKDSSTLKGATIEIVQSYKPEIKQSVKPESVPLLPPVDTSTAKVNFNVPSQALYYSYNALPLRPLTLTKDSAANPFRNYVKLGGGNLSTFLFDAGIAALHGKNYETAIHLHHLSQSGNITGQKTSLTGLEAAATLKAKRNIWHVGLGLKRDVYHYYGDDPFMRLGSAYTQSKPEYTGAALNVDMQNSQNTDWSYHPSFHVSYYGNNGANEQKVSVVVPVSYNLSPDVKLRIGIAGMYAGLSRSVLSANASSNIAQLLPGIDFVKGNFTINAGLYPTIGQNNSYLLPDIKASYVINKNQLTLFAGWKGALRQNTYEQLSGVNPYLYNAYSLQQTHADEIFGGLQTNLGNHISFSGKVSWWQYENMPLFVNDTAKSNQLFMISYDKVNALSFQGSIRYQIANTIAIGFGATYITYNTTINKRAWHEPGIRINADLMVVPMKNMVVTAYLTAMDETYAVEVGNKTLKLNSAFDMGIGAEYSFMPRLGAFVNVNNIFNNQYERWYGYRVYGFNILGGLRLKF